MTAKLLHGVLTAQIRPTFHKINVHAAMTPEDILTELTPVFEQARLLREAYDKRREDSGFTHIPFVTVSLLYIIHLEYKSVSDAIISPVLY